MTCKDYIHEKVCDALIKSGCPYLDKEIPANVFCMEFKNKADAVEVIRCKDCISNRDEFCNFLDRPIAENDFCSYGKKVE